MKPILTAAAAFACLAPAAAFAQTAPAAPAAPVAPAAPEAPAVAARFTLDTPIETLAADEKAKTVLAADLGMDVTQHPMYDSFKGMSLRQVQPFSEGRITDEILVTVEKHLAEIK